MAADRMPPKAVPFRGPSVVTVTTVVVVARKPPVDD
jgi:hypothetical protein